MLKNVAIPLMLAASEAEAQAPTPAQILDALKVDRMKDVPRLIADAAACTATSATVENQIDTLAGTVATKEAALEAAKQAVLDLQAADGAWGLANQKREAAVAAALAQETTDGIAALLATFDEKAEAERGLAADYVTKEQAYTDAVQDADAKTTAKNNAATTLSDLETAMNTAKNAAEAVRTQVGKETSWRSDLFCELGATVTNADITYDSDRWWSMLTGYDSTAADAGTEPTTCDVAAVTDADNNEIRGAVQYWRLKGNTDATYLETETDTAPIKKWQANTVFQEADKAENDAANPYSAADTAMGTTERNKHGIVAWYVGAKRKFQYIYDQRTQEQVAYQAVMQKADDAKTYITNWHNDDGSNSGAATYIAPLDDTTKLTGNPSDFNMGQSCASQSISDGATETAANTCKTSGQWLKAKADARAVAKAFGGVRGADGMSDAGNWKSAWTFTTTSIDAWKSANASTPNDAYTWWDNARQLTAALNTWYTAYAATPLSINSAAMVAATDWSSVESTEQGTGKICIQTDVDSTSWTADTDSAAIADADGCRKACIAATWTKTVEAMKYTPDGGTEAERGYAPILSAAPQYCGAYSWGNDPAGDGVNTCKLLIGTSANLDTTSGNANEYVVPDSGAGKCEVMVQSRAAQAPDVSSKNWYTLSKAVYDKFVVMKDEGGTDSHGFNTAMIAAMDTQADLEVAWLEAWYDTQYWTALAKKMDVDDADADANLSALADAYGVLAPTSGAPAAMANYATNSKAAELKRDDINGKLTTQQNELSALSTTTAEAQSEVTALERRINRATAEIKVLNELSTGEKTSTTGADGVVTYSNWGTGKLDLAEKLRTAEYDAYNLAGTGPNAVAIAESTAADALIQLQVMVGGVEQQPWGTVRKERDDAQGLWEAAKLETVAARNALTDALDGADLAALKGTVTTDTGDWDIQQGALQDLIDAVVTAEDELDAARNAEDAAVIACQVKAYDAYRSTLEDAMVARNADLVTIKGLITAELTKKEPGTEGARCEKALSNGTFRPSRTKEGEEVCGDPEEFCCGAARVWMAAGSDADGAPQANAMWRTIETCQKADTAEYTYTAARAPLSTDAATTRQQTVPFTCIQGAKKLAAAASALAAAYMLA